MINLDLNSDEAYVYCSTFPVSVARIGDVIVLSKKLGNSEFNKPRSPWYFLFKGNKLNNFGGRYTNNDEIHYGDAISLSTEDYNIKDLVNIDKQEFSLALLQGGICYSLAVLTRCRIEKYNRIDKKLGITFIINKCEMIYDK